MISSKKSLVVSGISGILIAIVMIASIALVSWYPLPKVVLGVSVVDNNLLALEGPNGVIRSYEYIPPQKTVLNVTLFEFTESLDSGSEADMVITLMSKLNYSEIFNLRIKTTSYADSPVEDTRVNFPAAIRLSDGGSAWSWTGNVEANETKTFDLRIKRVGTGLGRTDFEIYAESVSHEYFSEDFPRQFQYVYLNFKIIPNNILTTITWPPLGPDEDVLIATNIWPNYDYRVRWLNHTGVGSELNLTTQLWGQNATNVTWRLILPEGAIAIDGPTAWTGNVTGSWDEPSMEFNTTLKFVKTGSWIIFDYVEKDGIFLDPPQIKVFEITENDAVDTIGL